MAVPRSHVLILKESGKTSRSHYPWVELRASDGSVPGVVCAEGPAKTKMDMPNKSKISKKGEPHSNGYSEWLVENVCRQVF